MTVIVNGNSYKKVTVDTYDACKDAYAIGVLTEWDESKTYDWDKIYNRMRKSAFIFESRRILERKEQ